MLAQLKSESLHVRQQSHQLSAGGKILSRAFVRSPVHFFYQHDKYPRSYPEHRKPSFRFHLKVFLPNYPADLAAAHPIVLAV